MMKTHLIVILLFVLSFNVHANHEITYYVYFETQYTQGPWAKTDILDKSEYKYLNAKKYEEMMGTTEDELVEKILSQLKDEKPDVYNWSYDLAIEEDTVVITPEDEIEKPETVKNELTASLTHNGFKAVKFKWSDDSKPLTIDDVTLPYLDLVMGPSKTENTDKEEHPDNEPPLDNKNGIWNGWLIGSVLLNLGLIGLLVFKWKKK